MFTFKGNLIIHHEKVWLSSTSVDLIWLKTRKTCVLIKIKLKNVILDEKQNKNFNEKNII